MAFRARDSDIRFRPAQRRTRDWARAFPCSWWLFIRPELAVAGSFDGHILGVGVVGSADGMEVIDPL